MIQFQNSQVLSRDEMVGSCVINHGPKSLLAVSTTPQRPSSLTSQSPSSSSSFTSASPPGHRIGPTTEQQFQNILLSRRRRRDTDGGRDMQLHNSNHHHNLLHQPSQHPQQQQQQRQQQNLENRPMSTTTTSPGKFDIFNHSKWNENNHKVTGNNIENNNNNNNNSTNNNNCSNYPHNNSSMVCHKIITETNAWLFGSDYVQRILDSVENIERSKTMLRTGRDGTVGSCIADHVDSDDYQPRARRAQTETSSNRAHQRPPKSSPITIPSTLKHSGGENCSKFSFRMTADRSAEAGRILGSSLQQQPRQSRPIAGHNGVADRRSDENLSELSSTFGKMNDCQFALYDYLHTQQQQSQCDNDELCVSSTSITWLDDDFNQEIADLMVRSNYGAPCSQSGTPTHPSSVSSTTASSSVAPNRRASALTKSLLVATSESPSSSLRRSAVEQILLARNRFKHTQTLDDTDDAEEHESAPGTPARLDEEDAIGERWLLDEEYSRLEAAKSAFCRSGSGGGRAAHSAGLETSRNRIDELDTPTHSSFMLCHHSSAFLPISPA